MPEGTALLKHDFVLVTEEESKDLREKSSRAALKKLGFGENVRIVDGLPVPEVD